MQGTNKQPRGRSAASPYCRSLIAGPLSLPSGTIEAKKAKTKLSLAKPSRNSGDKAWWENDSSNTTKILDRKLFS